jgi:hypothetical protein
LRGARGIKIQQLSCNPYFAEIDPKKEGEGGRAFIELSGANPTLLRAKSQKAPDAFRHKFPLSVAS